MGGEAGDGRKVEAVADTRRRVVKKINTHMCRVRKVILITV